MPQITALIVDDETDICELFTITLNRMQINTKSAHTLAEARNYLAKQTFNLCLTDMRLPDGNGLDLVDLIQQNYPEIPIAVITAHGNMQAAIRALKAGAFDFLPKPVDLNNLRQIVASALQLPSKSQKSAAAATESKLKLLGTSNCIQELQHTISKLARSQAPVYIHGESGTGKELVARLIHQQSARHKHPFVAINCGAIPTELLESEFFGHKKGSFTGAHADKTGLFQAADNGTLFLDEIAELPIMMQVKLLRVIQERTVRPVGANEEVKIDVRILSATHKSLADLIDRGEFRQDLYYRLNVIPLNVPSLREHKEDIPLLTTHILQKIAEKYQIPVKTLSEDALRTLQNYHFPGNVRELENILERAATLSEGAIIYGNELELPENRVLTEPMITLETLDNNAALDEQLSEREKLSIIQALEQARWNKTKAAKLLGISFRQLRYRIKKLKIE